MTNDRLRAVLIAKRMSHGDLAIAIEVDPKTVERWVTTGRLPRQRHRALTAEALKEDETYLWPQLLGNGKDGVADVVAVYPSRGDVPSELWRRLVDEAESHVDILVYSGLFLLDSHPDLPTKLIERASKGLKGRFLYGNPDAQIVAARGEEEGIGDNLAARIRLSLNYMSMLSDVPGLEVRQHESILYNSIYRFDRELLVNTHVAGSPAPQNPVLHIRRTERGTMFDQYMESFDAVWLSGVRR